MIARSCTQKLHEKNISHDDEEDIPSPNGGDVQEVPHQVPCLQDRRKTSLKSNFTCCLPHGSIL